MVTTLNDAEIVRISTILSSDTEAVAQKEKIYGSLELPQADMQDLNKAVHNERSGSYGFFTTALLKYRARTGSRATVNSLIDRFTKLNLINVVEAIQGVTKSERSATVINPSVSGLGGIGHQLSNPQVPTTNSLSRYVFRKCSKTIREKLQSNSIISMLYHDDVLTQGEYEDIRNLDTVTNREKLITVMMGKNDESVRVFIEIVKEATASQDYIWKELEQAIHDFQGRF